MAIVARQENAAPEPKGTQLDIEKTAIDRACDAVRGFQSGKTTAGAVGQALRAVALADLAVVAVGTRLPVATLKTLRGE
jgi:3D (Asp-Asp-Asp) domain-containing protein